jgi:hypothetical protein
VPRSSRIRRPQATPLEPRKRADLCSAVQRTCSAPITPHPLRRSARGSCRGAPRGLLLGAREQVAVAVERDGHRAVTEEGRKGLGVDAGSDHERGEVCGGILGVRSGSRPGLRQWRVARWLSRALALACIAIRRRLVEDRTATPRANSTPWAGVRSAAKTLTRGLFAAGGPQVLRLRRAPPCRSSLCAEAASRRFHRLRRPWTAIEGSVQASAGPTAAAAWCPNGRQRRTAR